MVISTAKPNGRTRMSKLGRMQFFRVDAKLRKRLQAASRAEGLFTSQIVRQAVVEYLDRRERVAS